MGPAEAPFDSDALRANIAGTAQEVVIPDRYLPLVQAVDGFYGVREDLMGALAEYCHSFRNVDHVIDRLQPVLLRDWTYFERSSDRAVCFKLLSELALGLLDAELSESQMSLLLRQLLSWCAAVLDGPYAGLYEESLQLIGERLLQALPQYPHAFLERDVLVRGFVERAMKMARLEEACSSLYRDLLLLGYRYLQERLPLPEWACSSDAGLADPDAVAAQFSMLAPERMAALIDTAENAPPSGLLCVELPLFSSILDEIIGKLFSVQDYEDRFAVCLYLLKDDTLGYRQSDVMSHLLEVVKQLMKPDHHGDVERILSRLTHFFKAHDSQFLSMRFQCYETIGVAIGEVGNARAADHLIEDVLSWQFQYPDIKGATDEWETVVNPFHLPNVRCWMHIIESNPLLYERLAAALNVQLRLGGVHIADTDLFQRDVTRFLNADIRPIYFVAKQFLKVLPVYFNDVGAEGELRAVSTELDEICERKDTLMHFLRKQSHAESSNRLVAFCRAILSYWMTLDPSVLRPYVSANAMASIRCELEWAQGPHRVLTELQAVLADDAPRGEAGLDSEPFLDRLVSLTPSALEHLLETTQSGCASDAVSTRRVFLMVRTYQLLAEKYSLSTDDLGSMVSAHMVLDAKLRRWFAEALNAWQESPSPSTRDALLDVALTVLERLKDVVLDPAPSTAVENLYQKRHIAAGIPSIYGSYKEAKFDALGLSFRIERLVARLLDDVVTQGIDAYVNRDSLRGMAATIRRFQRALAVDGVDSQELNADLCLLESSLSSRSFTFHQYRNVFQFIVGGVTELARTSIITHDQVLRAVLENDPRQCEARSLSPDAAAEMVLREVLVTALGMQTLDRYAAMALRRISTLAGHLSDRGLTRMMDYDPERLVSPIHRAKPETDDQRTLGVKGLGLKQMASYGHRVPEGFILTTELFRVRPALAHPALRTDTVERIRSALAQLESETGLRLGDTRFPLTLSIRSGAAISMPGLMATFVDVGLNDTLAEALSRKPGFEWAAWDSYRRFLQSWAMSSGVSRDFFDDIMNEFKVEYGVERKIDFLPEQMREIASAYKNRARELGVEFEDDPFNQVVACIKKVLDSWSSPGATLYREYLGIAPEWGTAVVVQRMVFGNLSRESGSGVTFTRDPLKPHTRQVRLFGDFTARSQGEDLVAGLVYPLPISEEQRLGSPTYSGIEHSLEKDYPSVYEALLAVARDLVEVREFDPQEIEFTFESASGKDLYILQKRAMVHEQAQDMPYFDTSSPFFGTPLAVGTGVAGGAYSGRVAITGEHIVRLLAESPDDGVILLRPDTVPEDIGMITQVSGLLTARGGATSHAAVTAKRLGKTAVVDCRDLEVIEQQGVAILGGEELKAGDWLSIDGRTGNIFLGRIPLATEPEPSGARADALQMSPIGQGRASRSSREVQR